LARECDVPLYPLSNDGIVVSLYWRAPELLLGTKHYTTSIDIWALGCIFWQLFRSGKPPFHSKMAARKEGVKAEPWEEEYDQLREIFDTCGEPSSSIWADARHLPHSERFSAFVRMKNITFPSKSATHSRLKKDNIDSDAAKLIEKMLVLDPSKRITASDALNDPFFADVRS
jgi:cyclin-dependent kinase 8/11